MCGWGPHKSYLEGIQGKGDGSLGRVGVAHTVVARYRGRKLGNDGRMVRHSFESILDSLGLVGLRILYLPGTGVVEMK